MCLSSEKFMCLAQFPLKFWSTPEKKIMCDVGISETIYVGVPHRFKWDARAHECMGPETTVTVASSLKWHVCVGELPWNLLLDTVKWANEKKRTHINCNGIGIACLVHITVVRFSASLHPLLLVSLSLSIRRMNFFVCKRIDWLHNTDFLLHRKRLWIEFQIFFVLFLFLLRWNYDSLCVPGVLTSISSMQKRAMYRKYRCNGRECKRRNFLSK